MNPEVAARGEIAAGWVDYVASGQFAEVIHDHEQDVALAIIREARLAWYSGVSHGLGVVVTIDGDVDPAAVLAVAEQLQAFVEQEERGRRGRRD